MALAGDQHAAPARPPPLPVLPAGLDVLVCGALALSLLLLYGPAYYELAHTVWATDEQGHGPIIAAVTLWLHALVRAAGALLLHEVSRVAAIDGGGARQARADVEYFVAVLSSMGLPPDPALARFLDCLAAPASELAAAARAACRSPTRRGRHARRGLQPRPAVRPCCGCSR